MFAVFVTWRDGRALLREELQRRAVPLAELPLLLKDVIRVPGTAVFLVSHQGFVPTALLRNLDHNRVCHETIIILHLEIQRSPRQDLVSRSYPEEVFPGIHLVHARFGFMETPDVTMALAGAARKGLRIDPNATFFLGWHLVRARARQRPRRHQDAALRLHAAPKRAGRGVLPHADQARRRARDGSRDLAQIFFAPSER